MIDLGEVTWALSMTEPGAFETPLSTGHQWDFVPAHVPGTVAGALTDAGLYDPENPVPLHGKDVWYEAWPISLAPGGVGDHCRGLPERR
jgi:beta-mannosidase